MDNKMNKSSAGIVLLGFFLTFIMVFCLISGGLVMAVKTTFLSGGDINEVIENTNLYETFSDIVVSEISTSEVTLGFSKEAVEKVFSEDVLEGAARTMTDAIKNNEDVDLSGVKDELMEVVKEISEKAVDDILDEIKNSSDVISIDMLKNTKTIKQLEQDYNVDITNVIFDYVEDTYGSVTINISDVDIEAVKSQAKKSLNESVIPTIEETVDEYIVEINASVNKHIQETNKEFDLSGTIAIVEAILSIINIAMITTLVLSVIFAVIQVAVLYRKCMNRGFRNIAIATLISGIVVLLTGIIFNIVKSFFLSSVGTLNDNIEQQILGFIADNFAAVCNRIVLIGCIYIGVAVVCMTIAIVVKKKLEGGNNSPTDSGMLYMTNAVK